LQILPIAIKAFLSQRNANQTYTRENLEIFDGNLYRLSWNKSESILEIAAQDGRGTLAKYNPKEDPVKLIEASQITEQDIAQWDTVKQIFQRRENQQATQRRGFRL